MKERTISLEYKGHKEYKYIMPGEMLTTIPCYEITVTWNNKIIEFKNRKMPLTESTVFISACKLNKEEEQRGRTESNKRTGKGPFKYVFGKVNGYGDRFGY